MKEGWWRQKASDAQAAADRNDSKAFYSDIVFGPSRLSVTSFRSKDGTTLLKDVPSIQNRWVEHYSELPNKPCTVNMDIIHNLPQRPIIAVLSNTPSLDKVISAVKK